MAGVKVTVDIGKYKWVRLPLEEAVKLLNKVSELLGWRSGDVDEALRYMEHFDEFYSMMKRKFKEFLVPIKRSSDMIRGRVIVDKLKLEKEGDQRMVTLVFDRRVDLKVVVDALENMGFEVEVEKRVF